MNLEEKDFAVECLDFHKRFFGVWIFVVVASSLLFLISGLRDGTTRLVACEALSGFASLPLMLVSAASLLICAPLVVILICVSSKFRNLTGPLRYFANFSMMLPAALGGFISIPAFNGLTLCQMIWVFSVIYGIGFLQWLYMWFADYAFFCDHDRSVRWYIAFYSVVVLMGAIFGFLPSQNWSAIETAQSACG